MSKFKILWIDDQQTKIGLEQDTVKEIIVNKGYTAQIETIDNIKPEDLIRESDLMYKIKSREYDLLFIDYKLSHKVLGSHIISKIREENKIYTDIIFYSTDKDDLIEEVINSYKGSILSYIDDVHIIPLDDADFYDKVETVIDKIIGTWYNAHSIRGIILAKTSKFEYIVNQIVQLYYSPYKDKLASKIKTKKENIIADITEKWDKTIKSQDVVEYVLKRPEQFNWNFKKMLFDTLIEETAFDISEEIARDISELFSLRNDFAHNKAKVINGNLILYKKNKELTFNESNIIEIRHKLAKVEKYFESLVNSLQ